MKHRFTSAIAVLAIAGCGGVSNITPQTSSLSAMPPTSATAAATLRPFLGAPQLASFEWGRSIREGMSFVAPAKVGAMEVIVQVRMRNGAGLLQYAQSASDPHSTSYRHFLTPDQIANRFAATKSDYGETAQYFEKLKMRVGMWPQRETLTVTGTFDQLSRAFGTSFGYFHYAGQTVVAPIDTPHFTKALPVTGVLNLSTYDPRRRYFVRGVNSMFVGYSPQMLASGFDYEGAYADGYNGSGVDLGVNGTGPISPADVPAYGARYRTRVANVVQVPASPQRPSNANGGTGSGAVDPYPPGLQPPPPITKPCQLSLPPNYDKCNPEDIEAQLDSEQVASLAPGATELFYIAYNPSICVLPNGSFVDPKKNGSCPTPAFHFPLMGVELSDDSLQQAIADNRADTQSLSWGAPENDEIASDYISSDPSKPGVGQVEFASLAAEGVAVFVASGDDGAGECFDPSTGLPLGVACVSYPASDPNVTAVGGVNVPILDNGMLGGQITAWADNTTAGGNGTFENNIGSGGGISAYLKPATWQSAKVGNAMREVPDIALDADPNTGPSIIIYAGFPGHTQMLAVGGTSAAAPEANAEWGLVLSACKQSPSCATASGVKPYRLGNAAPLLYSLYKTSSYGDVFYDVVYGNNQAVPAKTPAPLPDQTPTPIPTPVGYSAGKGYDMVTGLGAPFGSHLVDAIVAGSKAP
jgi:subtilase family serine protease